MKKDKKGFITEFKEFIMRGNVFDMAIGVIIAGAFGKITSSLVNDIFMPFLGFIIGDFDLSKFNITLAEAELDAAGNVTKEAVLLGLGNLISVIIDFLLIALIIFLLIKGFAKTKELTEKKLLKKQAEEPVEEAPAPPTTEQLLADILSELKKEK